MNPTKTYRRRTNTRIVYNHIARQGFYTGGIILFLGFGIIYVFKGSKKDTKICPFCAEMIKRKAIVCKHCGRDIPTDILDNDSE